MDVLRETHRRFRNRRLLMGFVGCLLLSLGTIGVGRWRPIGPSVDASGLLIDTVQRGTLVREVRGPGSLIPERCDGSRLRHLAPSNESCCDPGLSLGRSLILELSMRD